MPTYMYQAPYRSKPIDDALEGVGTPDQAKRGARDFDSFTSVSSAQWFASYSNAKYKKGTEFKFKSDDWTIARSPSVREKLDFTPKPQEIATAFKPEIKALPQLREPVNVRDIEQNKWEEVHKPRDGQPKYYAEKISDNYDFEDASNRRFTALSEFAKKHGIEYDEKAHRASYEKDESGNYKNPAYVLSEDLAIVSASMLMDAYRDTSDKMWQKKNEETGIWEIVKPGTEGGKPFEGPFHAYSRYESLEDAANAIRDGTLHAKNIAQSSSGQNLQKKIHDLMSGAISKAYKKED